MHSLIVQNFDRRNARRYSRLRVLPSTAGFYIGTLFTDDDGRVCSGSRDSVETYPRREQAEKALRSQSFTTRTMP